MYPFADDPGRRYDCTIKARTEPRKKPLAPGERPRPGRRRWRWAWVAGVLALVLLLLPLAEVAAVKFIHPPATPLMGLRWVEARFSGESRPRVLYHWLDWKELPTLFLRSAWVSEDQRFFTHHGFDWIEMRHSIDKAERTGREPRGSSTITQQCARSLFLWTGHSYVRKALEAYYTVLMEAMLSKRRIFELYANVVEMGPGVYGVGAASRYHYGIDARQLGEPQAAMLAALLPAPLRWNPKAPTPRLLARQQRVMRDLPTARWPNP